MYNQIEKLASAIYNDVVSGLRGFHHNLSLSLEQLEDEIVEMRLQILKEYSLKGIMPVKDLYLSINCIPIDCKDIERCRCQKLGCKSTPTAHFEIPLIINDYGSQSIAYIGSADRQLPFIYYTTPNPHSRHQYRKRGKDRPYVWIDTTPNENGMYDCFVFNAPLLKQISITAIFKDLRLLDLYECCTEDINNISFVDMEVKKRLTEMKIRYYRLYQTSLKPNDQQYTTG